MFHYMINYFFYCSNFDVPPKIVISKAQIYIISWYFLLHITDFFKIYIKVTII